MFERPRGGERAVLVSIAFDSLDNEEALQEFKELAVSAAAEPIARITGRRKSPDAKYFVGTGKVEEIRDVVAAEKAEVVLFNHALSPAQERNLERLFQCRVLDRTGLILDIFAQRARTHEGKLQVELAQLQHLSTRLVRGWTHLERQKGGIGLRGPGETQLETDRRLLGDRIRQIHKRLAKVNRQRDQGRRSRRRAELATVSLVGYTNAGKSTLFNRMTDASVYAADQLFATLDPTLRKVELPNGQSLILADTVGFIRDLPHDLVAAFRSTLQETRDADLLLHVIDACSENRDGTIYQVNEVLAEIDADSVQQLQVYNKIDLFGDMAPRIDRDSEGKPVRVWISAKTGAGIPELLQCLYERVHPDVVRHRLMLTPAVSRLRARIYQLAKVHGEQVLENGNCVLDAEFRSQDWDALCKHDALASYIQVDSEPERLAAAGEAP